MVSHRLFATLILEGALVVSTAGCDKGDDPETSGDEGEEGEAEAEAEATTNGSDGGTAAPDDMSSTGADSVGDGDGDAGTDTGADTSDPTTGGSTCPDTCDAAEFGIAGETDWAEGCTPISTLCCWVTDSCCDLCC